MKKEYLILAVIIAGLCAYLMIHNENRNNYSLPELKTVAESDITGIAIEQKGKTLQITKANEIWGVTEKSYPADTDKIKALIKTISTLKITALASEKGDLQRYQLDPENRVKVTASGKSNDIRTFEVGKTAPSYNHTFVKLKGDDHIYHAAGNFQRDFDVNVGDLRDKKVLSFDEKTIKEMKFTTSGITRTLVAKPPTLPPQKTTKEETTENVTPENITPENDKTAPEGATKKTWHFEDNTPGDEASIKKILSTFSTLECNGYTLGDDKKVLAHETPLCHIVLTGEQEMFFTLFEKNSDGKYPALSSTTPFPFVLDDYSGEDILSSVETLLGIEKKPSATQEE